MKIQNINFMVNLPALNPLYEDQSTYITFSKALLDFDKAINAGTKYAFSKMVALNLPQYQNPGFYMNLTAAGVTSTNPNVVFPKAIQLYMENIIRQNYYHANITEVAFWKLLNKFGMTYQQIKDSITFINSVAVSNFIDADNNNGWGELILQIPNKCAKLNLAQKNIVDFADTIQSEVNDGLFDNGNLQFTFSSEAKNIIDFDQTTYSDIEKQEFSFNVLLLFYQDASGINKLHGINFINPYTNKIVNYELPTFVQKTNDARSFGYQFKMNMKTCNNEASQLFVYEQQTHSWYNNFAETLSSLNTFLKKEIRNQ